MASCRVNVVLDYAMSMGRDAESTVNLFSLPSIMSNQQHKNFSSF